MNFYEELDRELKSAGLKGEIKHLSEEQKPTAKDFYELERKITIRVKENENMMYMSSIYANRNIVGCSDVKPLVKCKK